jgi:hypothetical protein
MRECESAWLRLARTSLFPGPMSESWIRSFVRRLDQLDPDGILPDFADDACLRINGDVAVGAQSIRAAFQRLFARLETLRHRTVAVFQPHAGAAALEADLECVRADGRTVSIPAATILRFEGAKIVDYRVLADLSAIA